MYSRGGGGVTKLFESSFENDLQVFRIALQSILKYGWIQNSAGDPEKGFCTMGGFSKALFNIIGQPKGQEGMKKYGGSAFYEFMPATKKEIFGYIGGENIPIWNDDPDRTENDVISFYEHMIDFILNRVATINATVSDHLRGS